MGIYVPRDFAWNDVKKSKPENFELVNIKYSGDRIRRGWWSGSQWDSVAENTNQQVLEWQKSALP